MSAYVNIHGKPLATSARDALIAVEPAAVCKQEHDLPSLWVVRRSARWSASIIGTGANEEAAWRDAWSRVLAEIVQREKVAK